MWGLVYCTVVLYVTTTGLSVYRIGNAYHQQWRSYGVFPVRVCELRPRIVKAVGLMEKAQM